MASIIKVKKGRYDRIISKTTIRNTTIKAILGTSEEKTILELTEKILNNKSINTDTFILEKEIDQLVYKLYDLTEEEIQIVESSVD